MYSLEQIPVLSVINDKSIRLPRFQRKESWTDGKRFQLCISVFKGYPIGTVVFRREEPGGKMVKWLLDGRQRIDTLRLMRNPHNIYLWAKAFTRFRETDSGEEVARAFYDAIDRYLFTESKSSSPDWYEDADEDEDGQYESVSLEPVAIGKYSAGLDELLGIIMSVHSGSKSVDAFTKPFDIKAEGFKPKYISARDNGRLYVESNKLTEWIYGNFEDENDISIESVHDCFNNHPSVRRGIENGIDGIRRSIKAVLRVKDRLSESKISIITLNEHCTEDDSKKIFEIINTQGTQLTNVEVLSAKPAWAHEIEEPRDILRENVRSLYEKLDIPIPEDVVYWDVAATFTCRLPVESDFIMGDIRNLRYDTETEAGKKETDRKLTYGFKLYAGRYSNSVSKGAVETLPSVKGVEWEYSTFEDEIRNACRLLLSHDPATMCFNGYRVPLHKLLGDAVTMCFLFLLLKKYRSCADEDGAEMVTRSVTKRKYIVKSHILLDRLFFEYCTGLWKGSGDSRLKNCLDNPDGMFEKVDDEEWERLIDDLYNHNRIGGIQPKKKVLDALVYYFSMIRGKNLGLQDGEKSQVDHIIPKSRFSEDCSGGEFRDSLVNYALLPASLNNTKRDDVRTLEKYLRERICNLEDLTEDELAIITETGAMDILRKTREPIIEDLKSLRIMFIKGEGRWSPQIS